MSSQENVRIQEEIQGSIRALLLDEEMEEAGRLLMEDGEWNPSSPMMVGGGDEPQPGPSSTPQSYSVQLKRTRTFAKTAATENVYNVKIHEEHQGRQLSDIRDHLHQMFDDVLDRVRGAGNDLGRIVIHHDGLHDAIVIPLQHWDQLNADTVMKMIEKVLNSNQHLAVNENMEITIGSIDLPKGSGGPRRRITKLNGKNNSLQLKTSIVTIENEDKLCMARAIGVAWAKLKRCTSEEWKEITKKRQKKLTTHSRKSASSRKLL